MYKEKIKSKNEHKVAVLTSSISRNAGGLFWSVRELSSAIKSNLYDFKVFSANDEHTAQDIKYWVGAKIELDNVLGPKSFGYQPGLRSKMNSYKPDIVHCHGIWMFSSVIGWYYSKKGIPTIISPRGMLDSWALENSKYKKKLAYALFEGSNLRNASCLHALNLSEYKAMRDFGLKNPIAIIPNGVRVNKHDNNNGYRKKNDSKVCEHSKSLLYISRIHPKKGIESLLRAWAYILNDKDSSLLSWKLTIAGWDQNGHSDYLKKLIDKLNLRDYVTLVGPKFDQEKQSLLEEADAFVLPSHSEGLPMAILEAWAEKLPVIMTPQCNIPQGFEHKAAICVDPTLESIAVGLSKLSKMSDHELVAMGEAGYKLVNEEFEWDIIGQKMRNVYNWLLNKSDKPDFVLLD